MIINETASVFSYATSGKAIRGPEPPLDDGVLFIGLNRPAPAATL
ncbi:hypothetical protein BN1263210116 [Stenotrophomonas maltophilia]|nr:hypothetical protein BN1263210116 [Stenotrophomonas maltophilia]